MQQKQGIPGLFFDNKIEHMEQVRDILGAKLFKFWREYLSLFEVNFSKDLWSTLWKGNTDGRQVVQNQSDDCVADLGRPAQTLWNTFLHKEQLILGFLKVEILHFTHIFFLQGGQDHGTLGELPRYSNSLGPSSEQSRWYQ